MHLFNDGFRYWFDQEEIKSITENNEQYQLRSPEEELLLTWFEVTTKEQAQYFLTAAQISSKLAEKGKLNVSDASINKLGKALKKHNFLRYKRNGNYVYAVKELNWEEVENRNKEIMSENSLENKQENNVKPSNPTAEQTDLPF